MAPIRYLTAQDALWLNQQITGVTPTFELGRLDDGISFQYALGKATDLPRMASQLAKGMVIKRPFSVGSRTTALAAFLTFCSLNELEPIGDLATIVDRALKGEIVAKTHEGHGHHEVTTAQAGLAVLDGNRELLRGLFDSEKREKLPLEPAGR